MKRGLIITTITAVLLLLVVWAMGQSSWHLDRNQLNDVPEGKLVLVQDTLYRDMQGRKWIRLPAKMNAFHQPDQPITAPAQPYGNALDRLNFAYDPANPNLKFLCITEDGGSLEAILQPNGQYLETGPLLGTYNYGHPSGFWGIVKHTVWDVLPHFANGKYRNVKATAH